MFRPEIRQYNIEYDQKETDVKFLSKQLETHLKERFNVLVSTVEYGIQDGHLVREGTKEPFIESIKKGRDLIQSLSKDTINVDREREDAEVTGFEKIDSFLSDPKTPLNSKMLSISPNGEKGSKYQHNFYDIFSLKEKNGKRCVELSRYSSALTRADYARQLQLDPNSPPEAKDFLANPKQFADLSITPEEIHKLLHKKHEYMAPSDFMEIWTSPLVQTFVKRYLLKRDARSFNAVLNAADEVWQNGNKGQTYEGYSLYKLSHAIVKQFEEKSVRQAGGQCPGKSGADTSDSAFSVSDFGLIPDKFGKRTFKCPACGKTNVRPENKRITNCQHCGSSKVAC